MDTEEIMKEAVEASVAEEFDTEDQIANAVEWLHELRNNQWTQIKGQLRNKAGGFCCLGVAAALTVKCDEESCCYSETSQALGIMSELSRIYAMNDSADLSFPEIATKLISHADTYFHPDVAEGVQEHFFTPGGDVEP